MNTARLLPFVSVRSLALSLALAPMLSACGEDGPVADPAPPTVTAEPTQEVDITPPPSTDGRKWRRMNIDQLSASLQKISGGIGWVELDENGEPYDVFERLAGSLGKPDFLNSNVEDLEPLMLFQKFLDDAAISVCDQWIERERTQSAQNRLLLVHVDFDDTPESAPVEVEANMRRALLRFHGKAIPEGDPMVEPWLTLLQTIYQNSGDMGTAWRGACVAMFTHPDFYTF